MSENFKLAKRQDFFDAFGTGLDDFIKKWLKYADRQTNLNPFQVVKMIKHHLHKKHDVM